MTIQEKARMIADQFKPCTKEYHSGIIQGVEIALTAEARSELYSSFMDEQTYVSKSKAHTEAENVFRAMDRKVIPSCLIENYKQAFQEAIDKINARNKRCKDLELTIWSPNDNADFQFVIYGVASLSLRKVKNI